MTQPPFLPHDEKTRYYFILKLFPFSLKGDAKAWYNTLAPGCVRSPQDMIYYFSEKYFPAHKKQAALQEIFNFVQIKEESLPQAWERHCQLLNALPDHPLKKNEILDIFYDGLTDLLGTSQIVVLVVFSGNELLEKLKNY